MTNDQVNAAIQCAKLAVDSGDKLSVLMSALRLANINSAGEVPRIELKMTWPNPLKRGKKARASK